jgi:hypothetical protein
MRINCNSQRAILARGNRAEKNPIIFVAITVIELLARVIFDETACGNSRIGAGWFTL